MVFTARCYAQHGYATASHVSLLICLPVCLSDVDVCFHTGWNTSQIISRPDSLRHLLTLTQHGWSGAMGTPPKLWWNRGGVRSTKNLQYLRNSARQDQGYYDGLIGSHIRAFDWCQNQLPWMTVNGRNVTLAEIKKNYRAQQKNLNEDRFITARCYAEHGYATVCCPSVRNI